MNRIVITIVSCFLINVVLTAQDIASIWIYGVEDGLPSNEIYKILQDKKGYIWFASDRGLIRYNGLSWKTYTIENGLSDNCILDIAQLPDGKILCNGLSGRITVLQDDQFNDFVGNTFIDSMNRHGANYRMLTLHKNKLLFKNFMNTPKETLHILKYSLTDNNVKVLPINRVLSKEGCSVYGLEHQRVIIFDYGPVRVVEYNRSELDTLSEVYFRSEIAKIEKEQKLILHEIGHDQMIRPGIMPIRWVDTIGSTKYYSTSFGLVRLNDFDNISLVIDNINCTSSLVDREENLWISTINNGVMRVPNMMMRQLNSFPIDPGDHPISLSSQEGHMLIGTEVYGLYMLNKDKKIEQLAGNAYYRRFLENIDSFCLDGIRLADNLSKVVNTEQKHRAVIAKVNGHEIVWRNSFRIDANEVVPKRSYDLIAEENGYWIATIDGLYKTSFTKLKNKSYFNVDTVYFSGERVNDIESFGNDILTANLGVGVGFVNEGQTSRIDHPLLNFKSINCIKAYSEDCVLFGLNDGLVRIQFDSFESPYHVIQAQKFTTAEGLLSNFIHDIEVHDDTIWIATPKGLMISPMAAFELPKIKPTVSIQRITVNENEIKTGELMGHNFENRENNFVIEIDGSSVYRNIGHRFYHYQLRSNDMLIEDESLYDGKIRLNNLSPGQYNLTVLTRNTQRIESDPIYLSWTINRHWTESWILRTIVAFLIFCIGIAYRQYQMKKTLKARQRQFAIKEIELKSIRSQMNPHFIYNVLNSIQMYIYENEKELAGHYLSKFSRLVRMFFHYSKLEFIAISHEIEFLEIYLEMEKLRLPDKLIYEVHCAQNINEDALLIPSVLIQPIVENAIKHGIARDDEAGYVKILFEFMENNKNYIVVKIENSGPRINSKMVIHSNLDKKPHALNIVRERLRLLRDHFNYHLADIDVQSPLDIELNKGTKITFILPVKYA